MLEKLDLVALWVAGSILVALIVGAMIGFGMGDEEEGHD